MFQNRFSPFLFLLSILFFVPINYSYSSVLAQNPFVVVLDAGHGGHDPGNLGNGYLEKNIALNIVLKAGRILEKTPGIKVIYTRKDDTFIDLFVRGEIANKAKADLFVSVHCDSHTSNAHGAGTFVLGLHANEQNFAIAKKENSVIYLEDNYAARYADYDINSPESVIGLTIMQEEFLDQSIALAKAIQDNFTNKLKRKDRKVKQAGFIVLHQTFMPSVLVETGFLTNDKEGAYLNSSNGQSEMGSAIADAILKYKKNVITGGVSAMSSMPSAPNPEMDEMVVAKASEAAMEKTQTNTIQTNTSEIAEKTEVAVAEMPKSQTAVKETLKETTEIVVTEVVNDAGRPKIVKEERVKVIDKVVEATEEKVVEAPKEEIVKKSASDIEFRVQLMASAKSLSSNDPIFKGLDDITKEPVNKLFRYMYGSTTDLIKAKLLKKVADAKGFKTSYLVAYKNGVRISIKEALKSASE